MRRLASWRPGLIWPWAGNVTRRKWGRAIMVWLGLLCENGTALLKSLDMQAEDAEGSYIKGEGNQGIGVMTFAVTINLENGLRFGNYLSLRQN
jgi:hypothetical protein